VLRDAGITLCYHNHHQEFTKVGGRLLLHRIFSETSLAGEPDTYWIQAGGGNPLQWVQKLAAQKRLPLIHLKDFRVTAKGEVQFAELGAGNLDFDPILAAATAGGCQSFIIEQDATYGRDPFESLAESFHFLQSRLSH
jgi:sugar phosphate isomerase/epimerase